jgi:malonyl-CoA O-methyltransferase
MSHRSRTPNLAVISPQEGYELWAASYGENMNPVQTLESKAIEELLPPLEGCTLLDLGCGKGRVSRLALERGAKRTVGMDFSIQMLQGAVEATSSDSAHYLAGSATHLPFKKETFDVVVCALLMGHIQELESILSKVSEVLRPRGYLLITDFHPYETLRGSVRSFKDDRNNRTYSIKQHLHTFEDYIRIFNKLKLVLEDLREPQYENFPLVFGLRAKKPSEN